MAAGRKRRKMRLRDRLWCATDRRQAAQSSRDWCSVTHSRQNDRPHRGQRQTASRSSWFRQRCSSAGGVIGASVLYDIRRAAGGGLENDGQTDQRQHNVYGGGNLAQENELGKYEARKRACGHVAGRVDEGRRGRGDIINEALRKQRGDGHPLHGGAQNAALALHHDENRAGDLDENEAGENPADGGRDGVQSQDVQRGLGEEADDQNQAGGGVGSESRRSGGWRGGRGG